MSRSRYKRPRNRGTKILTTIFSVLIVLSVLFSLFGTFILRDPGPPPGPTSVFPTFTPLATSTASPTPTAGIPTPLVVTPTPGS